MKVAFGMKAHSGWAASVTVGRPDDGLVVVDRCQVELVADQWAKQPYHAAKGLKPAAARDVVQRGIDAAQRIAAREMRGLISREEARGNEVTACAVLVGASTPAWSTEEILAVHFRMHQAEGVLFRDALVGATQACGLRLVVIPQKQLTRQAASLLATTVSHLEEQIARLGKPIGPPWGKDQKDAALAALVALKTGRKRA